MAEYSTMPDLEAVTGSALRTAGVSGGRVYSSVPANPTYPLTVVQRIGGLPVDKNRLDAARIQVSVWGNNQAEARDAAELARRTLMALAGTADATFDAYVTCVEDDLGMIFLPDPATSRDRYIFGVVVYGHDFSN